MSGWLGSLRTTLQRAETTHQTRPEGENVVEIPNGMDKMRKAIVAVNNEIVHAQTERAAYHESWRLCLVEVSTAYARNSQRQRDAAHRLARLQEEWVRICHDIGIKADVSNMPIDETLPEGLERIRREQ